MYVYMFLYVYIYRNMYTYAYINIYIYASPPAFRGHSVNYEGVRTPIFLGGRGISQPNEALNLIVCRQDDLS